MSGVLAGVRIIELAGIGPAPFAAMMLADHGAEVVRVERIGGSDQGYVRHRDCILRSRKVIEVDLKSARGQEVVRRLCADADGLIEGFRPGVMERLGLSPDELVAAYPHLVVGRMTGWGQSGPLAHRAGHDINYIALNGALDAIGRRGEPPVPPINILGDFGGGGMLLAFGMVSAILNARSSGQGQVIDCAMIDGSALLMSMVWAMRGIGEWQGPRGTNLLDTGAHFYDTYETADGQHVAIGAIEPTFYRTLLERVGVSGKPAFDDQLDKEKWPDLKAELARIFRQRTRDEWCAIFQDADACFSPVLSLDEAPRHPHIQDRRTFIDIDGMVQPAPAPRFSRTPAGAPTMPACERNIDDLLTNAGLTEMEIVKLIEEGVIA